MPSPRRRASGDLPAIDTHQVEIQRPNQPEHGDYSSNVALLAASTVRKSTGGKVNPRQIAQSIVDHLARGESGGNGRADAIGSVELAGPGFINLRLSQRWLQDQVPAIVAAGADFGAIDKGVGQRWQVEYVSANPTGPLHYGGGRNAVLGDTLANLLEAAGYEVQREFYVNDSGTQFQLFIESLYACYLQRCQQESGSPGPQRRDSRRRLPRRLSPRLCAHGVGTRRRSHSQVGKGGSRFNDARHRARDRPARSRE